MNNVENRIHRYKLKISQKAFDDICDTVGFVSDDKLDKLSWIVSKVVDSAFNAGVRRGKLNK